TLGREAPTIWQALEDVRVLSMLSADGRARSERVREVFREAFAARTQTGLCRWLERCWLALGGPACAHEESDLADAAAAFARFRDLERRGLPDPADLAGEFANLYARDAVPAAVEIMTIHKAKGLEFDLVVLPGLDRAVVHREDEFLLSLQFARSGRDAMIMASRPAVGAAGDPLFDFLRAQARDGADLEAERLLYVACTRAKRELCLSAVMADERGETPAKPPRTGSLLAALWPVAGGQFSVSADALVPGTAAREGLRRMPAGWSPPAWPVPPEVLAESTATSARESRPPFDWVGETARQVGTLVHAQLQRLDLRRCDPGSLREREPEFRRWLSSRGVPSAWLGAAGGRVVAALVTACTDPRGRWILEAGRREDMRERAWSGVCNGELVHGVFDRSFIDEQGVRWVIDYKTSEHQGGGLQAFLDREVDRYRPQMNRYAELAGRLGPEPVRIGLYFPLMGAWREWSADAVLNR
ncbi:MAG: hypothetical protein HKM03_08055, partial [Steroidobacteraceae bacterium]|nr:hypothetical protein [Steroidobacteraceae bacterium]